MIVWSSLPFDSELFLQANARLMRQGRSEGFRYIHSLPVARSSRKIHIAGQENRSCTRVYRHDQVICDPKYARNARKSVVFVKNV